MCGHEHPDTLLGEDEFDTALYQRRLDLLDRCVVGLPTSLEQANSMA